MGRCTPSELDKIIELVQDEDRARERSRRNQKRAARKARAGRRR